MPEASHKVIVHETGRLHERVADCRSDECEPSPDEIFAHGVRLRAAGGNLLQIVPLILAGCAIDESPAIGIEISELLLRSEECIRVANGGANFELVADNAGIGH